MKRLARILAPVATVLLSSCVSIAYSIRSPELPADLDGYLSRSESGVKGVIPGDEKTIAWAGEKGAATPVSLVYIPGWQGTRWDYDPIFARVAKSIGANIYYGRLRGYGITTDEIVDVTVSDWVNDAWEALQIGHRIGTRVVVAGSSMGGDLSLWAATRPGAGIDGLVLLSPAVKLKDPRSDLLLWPWPFDHIFVRAILGKYVPNTIALSTYPTANQALYAEHNPARIRSESFLKLAAMVKLTRTLPLASITAPSLWLYNEKDDALDVSGIKDAFERAGGAGKRLVSVPDANGHMMAGDMFQPETTDEVTQDILSFLHDNGLDR